MGSQLRKFPFNEAEGGAPENGPYDIAMRRMPTIPNNQVLPFERSGATRGSLIYANTFGGSAQGYGSVQPTPIPDYFYFGQFPLSLQPTLDKPNPWE